MCRSIIFRILQSNKICLAFFHDLFPGRQPAPGVSLGINLLPSTKSTGSFNCIIANGGWTPETPSGKPDFPSREIVRQYLEHA